MSIESRATPLSRSSAAALRVPFLHRVLVAPEQRHRVRPGREVLQSRVTFGDKTYLVRVFVDVDRKPAEVVTAYRTSKIAKYWRAEP